MKLRQIFEAPRKVAVAAFGRMNPPTIGHEKLVSKITAIDGDHYLFLSQTQKPKDNPLPFDVKLEFSKKFFPGVNVGHPTVRTPIQMLQMLEKLGYTDIVYVAGSDRVEQFEKLFNDYNGKDYNFNSIQVVSAGERDPDADGAEGMSASKMRAAAASGDFDSFAQGVPTPVLAQKLYDAVRTGMGIKDTVSNETGYRRDAYQRDYDNSTAGMGKRQSYAYSQDGGANDEGNDDIDAALRAKYAKQKEYEQTGKFWLKQKDTQQHVSGEFVGKAAANAAALELLKQRPELKGNLVITAYGPDEKQEGVAEGLGKTIKRGMAGWGAFDKDKPADVVKRVKGQDTDTLKGLSNRGSTGKGSPAELQQKAISRELKKRGEQGVAEGAPIVVAQAPIHIRNPKKDQPKQRYMGDIVPDIKPPSTEKRGVKGRPGQRPMPKYDEASYEGNIGIMELFKFFSKAEKEDPKLVAKVKDMIKQRRDKEVWRIIQDYTGTQLTGKEFEGSIKEAIFREAGHGKYWCSTDKKWKYRQGPKQTRSS